MANDAVRTYRHVKNAELGNIVHYHSPKKNLETTPQQMDPKDGLATILIVSTDYIPQRHNVDGM